MYIYDSTRSAWLSIQRLNCSFGRLGATKDQYINFGGGMMPSNNSGMRMIRDATLTGISVQLDSSGTCNVYIRKNDSATNIATLAVSAATGAKNAALDVDVSADDFLQCYVEATTAINDPMVILEYSYRK